MYCDNGTELTTSTDSHLHIINRSSGKNCSTSSTDSGVGLVDNAATFKAGPTTKDSSPKSGSRNCEAATEPAQTEAEATAQNRISIEVEATVNISNNAATAAYRPKKSSPALSVRSTTISIVSIDENAIDSSCIDSDSEAEPDESCTVQKLGQQITHPPHSAELTQLNKGMTVISRQVLPTGGAEAAGAQPTPPDVLAKQLLNGNLSLATPTAPSATQQIGSIALSNTTDVTFGDKHYYEGPVTIQQILIDNREKWKPLDGETGGPNPGFNAQGTSNGNAAGGKVNESCKEPVLCPFLPSSITMKAVFITAAFALFTVGLLVVLATTTNIFSKSLSKSKLGDGEDSRLNIPINSKIAVDGNNLVLVSIDEWDGKMTRSPLERLEQPVNRVIIAHTVTENCITLDACSYRVRAMQAYHMDSLDWPQVGYNFMIGGDGRVYVGRGWDFVGAHTINYNRSSIGIAFIGGFDKTEPTPLQLRACELLLEEGVRLNKLSANYQLYGHRQLLATQSPGDKLYSMIKTWPHFAKTT
ncbi:PREDICTED: peptidoglycan-recognition protein LC isoform X2 [Drosophila arizonae]|uniref:Peptidoglycan-recognition protein LC isoform X2 n=1 Tax=Drosophila arizonae TaxID=7263 RepID=A0ABM1P2P1_DROAR|nr:PREDICTED: peptidoglycan-recognition protein LC isoform X2 [Drosophila arizonae]